MIYGIETDKSDAAAARCWRTKRGGSKQCGNTRAQFATRKWQRINEEYSRERRGRLKRKGNPLFVFVFAHLPDLDGEEQRCAFSVQ